MLLQKRHTVAGTLARTTAQCIVHPLDTIKTRLQVRPLPLAAPPFHRVHNTEYDSGDTEDTIECAPRPTSDIQHTMHCGSRRSSQMEPSSPGSAEAP